MPNVMIKLRQTLADFAGNKSGATAIEYGLLAAGISVVIIATVFALGTELSDQFNNVLEQLKGGGGGAGAGGGAGGG